MIDYPPPAKTEPPSLGVAFLKTVFQLLCLLTVSIGAYVFTTAAL